MKYKMIKNGCGMLDHYDVFNDNGENVAQIDVGYIPLTEYKLYKVTTFGFDLIFSMNTFNRLKDAKDAIEFAEYDHRKKALNAKYA